jgi:hypothetical protein
MDAQIALGLFAFCVAALYIMQRSLRLLQPLVWIRTDAEITGADISRSGESGSKLVITVEYRAPATGAPDHAGPAQRYEQRFVRKESGWDKFKSDQYRIDTSLA